MKRIPHPLPDFQLLSISDLNCERRIDRLILSLTERKPETFDLPPTRFEIPSFNKHFFRSSNLLQGGRGPGEDTEDGPQGDVVNFCDFVRVLAHFRPLKKTAEKNRMNSREDKLRCKFFLSWKTKRN